MKKGERGGGVRAGGKGHPELHLLPVAAAVRENTAEAHRPAARRRRRRHRPPDRRPVRVALPACLQDQTPHELWICPCISCSQKVSI